MRRLKENKTEEEAASVNLGERTTSSAAGSIQIRAGEPLQKIENQFVPGGVLLYLCANSK